MPEPQIRYLRILQLLNTANIRYVVIGGVAMHLHGANNLTFDMDISFARDRGNTDALAQLLAGEKARPVVSLRVCPLHWMVRPYVTAQTLLWKRYLVIWISLQNRKG